MSNRIKGIIEAVADIAAQPGDGLLDKIKAYHGSPHDFDQFSSDNIGSGEGAQAYGHGLYFAEREPTAMSYRDALTPRDVDYEEYLMDQYKAAEVSQDYSRMEMLERAMQHDTPADFRDIATDADYDDDYRQLAASMADEMEGFISPSGNPVNFGHMYEVNIDARPEELIDFDAPLSQQSEKVQNAFNFKPAPMPNFTASDVKKTSSDNPAYRYAVEGFPAAETVEKALNQANKPVLQNTGPLGLEAYNKLARELANETSDLTGAKSASEQLKSAGIKGIKYADAQTRFSPKGKTSNYVIFDDKLVEIARKYGVSMPVAGAILAGSMTPEQAQASTDDDSQGLLGLIGDAALEAISGVNRGVVDGANFLTADPINAILNLSGSDKRVPDLYDIPGVESGTKGNYMEPGLSRQIIRQGSEFFSPI